MTSIIDYPSLLASIGGETAQLMVYGFADCKYNIIVKILRTAHPFGTAENPIKRVFDFRIADYRLRYDRSDAIEDPIKTYTSEGREIFRIKRSTSTTARICKAALVNMVIENVKREREGLPLIPVLFTIDISSDTSGQYPPCINDLINIRNRYTFKELRRVYKLCADPELPPEVRAIAERTFKFVKVLVSTSPEEDAGASSADLTEKITTIAFETIKAPWQKDHKSWLAAMAEYTEKKKTTEPKPSHLIYIEEKKEERLEWRPQLLEAIDPSKFKS